jgi:hypothetical protein
MANIKAKHVNTWLRSLPENKWRKTYNVDSKRIAHFANLGEDIELPVSLSRKTSDGYIREKKLAKEFMRHLRLKEREMKKTIKVENTIRTIVKSILKEELKNG